MAVRGKSNDRSQGPTLRSIAELAGCSLMTVSRALNGVKISPEYAARIQEAVDTLGYIPNVAARRMRGGRTNTIGILMNADFDPRNEIMAIVDFLIREMEESGNQVLLSISRGGEKQADAHLRGFIARGVDGLFIWNATPSKVLERYHEAGIPVIAVAFRDPGVEGVPLVTVDAAPVFAAVFREMEKRGHRLGVELTSGRIPALHSVILGTETLTWTQYEIKQGSGGSSLEDFLDHISADPDPPTLVVTDWARSAQLLQLCEQRGIEVPRDLSVISIVDAVGAPLLRTPLSAFRTDYEAMGLAAAESMVTALDGARVEDTYVPGGIEWIERASTGPAPAR